MLKLLGSHKLNTLGYFVQLFGKLKVLFIRVTSFTSIFAYSYTVALLTLPFSSNSDHLQIGGVRYRLLGHSIDTSSYIDRISRAASTSSIGSLFPLSSGFFRLESGQKIIHELFNCGIIDIGHLEQLLGEGNYEQTFFREFLYLIGHIEKGVEFLNSKSGSGLIGQDIMKEVSNVDCGGH